MPTDDQAEEYMAAYEQLVDVVDQIMKEISGSPPPVGVTMEAMWRRPDLVPPIAAYFAKAAEERADAH